MIEVVRLAEQVMKSGGKVMWALLGVSMMLWFTATLRASILRRGGSGSIRDRVERSFVAAPDRSNVVGPVEAFIARAAEIVRCDGTVRQLDRLTKHALERVERLEGVLHSLVVAAPLLGLLGTVNGMVETFSSLQGVGVSQVTEQSVAGGVAVALLSTQFGLVIGVPGFIVAEWLRRVQARRTFEILEARALLGARLGGRVEP